MNEVFELTFRTGKLPWRLDSLMEAESSLFLCTSKSSCIFRDILKLTLTLNSYEKTDSGSNIQSK